MLMVYVNEVASGQPLRRGKLVARETKIRRLEVFGPTPFSRGREEGPCAESITVLNEFINQVLHGKC